MQNGGVQYVHVRLLWATSDGGVQYVHVRLLWATPDGGVQYVHVRLLWATPVFENKVKAKSGQEEGEDRSSALHSIHSIMKPQHGATTY